MAEYSFKELERMLSKYKWYMKQAKLIELSIRYPVQFDDQNIGGSRSVKVYQDEGMLKTLIRLEENETLKKYLVIIEAIDKTHEELPDYLQEVMTHFYINREGPYRGLAKRTAARLIVDESTLYRWRTKVTELFNEKLEDCMELHDIRIK